MELAYWNLHNSGIWATIKERYSYMLDGEDSEEELRPKNKLLTTLLSLNVYIFVEQQWK